MHFFAVSTTTCSDLSAPTNGMIAYNMEGMNARPLNTVATFTCITGYTVTGDMTRNCGAGGMWSGTNPTCECESIQCGYSEGNIVCVLYLFQWLVQTSPSQPMEGSLIPQPPSPELRAPRLPTLVPLATR